MMLIEDILDQVYQLPDSVKSNFISNFDEITVNKGELIIEANKSNQFVYLIKKGIVRAYSTTPNHDVTFYFGTEGDVLISMNQYVNKNVSYENIEALEDCILYRINFEILEQLYEDNLSIANWGRKFAEYELLKTEQRFINRLIGSAEHRYLQLIKNHSSLLQRVALGHLASYLGITQVSLSRIRSKIQ